MDVDDEGMDFRGLHDSLFGSALAREGRDPPVKYSGLYTSY